MMSKLNKMKMPMKKPDAAMADDYGLEMPAEGSDQEEASESPEEEGMEAPLEGKNAEMLAQIPDEELMAELKKRGLSDKLDSEEAGESPDAEASEEQMA